MTTGTPQTLDYAQLENAWVSGGGSTIAAPMAAAIAIPESGGNTNNVNTNISTDPGGSFGLWQINRGAHEQALGSQWFANSGLAWTGGPSVAAWGGAWTDPVQNAAEAVALSGNGSTWMPWQTTYENGSWKQFYNPAVQPVGGSQPTPGGVLGNLPPVILGPGGVLLPVPGATLGGIANETGSPFSDWISGVSLWWSQRPIALLIVALVIVAIGLVMLLGQGSKILLQSPQGQAAMKGAALAA